MLAAGLGPHHVFVSVWKPWGTLLIFSRPFFVFFYFVRHFHSVPVRGRVPQQACRRLVVAIAPRDPCLLLFQMAQINPRAIATNAVDRQTIVRRLRGVYHASVQLCRSRLCKNAALSILLVVFSCIAVVTLALPDIPRCFQDNFAWHHRVRLQRLSGNADQFSTLASCPSFNFAEPQGTPGIGNDNCGTTVRCSKERRLMQRPSKVMDDEMYCKPALSFVGLPLVSSKHVAVKGILVHRIVLFSRAQSRTCVQYTVYMIPGLTFCISSVGTLMSSSPTNLIFSFLCCQ